MALNHWPLNFEKEIYWNWLWGLYYWILSWNAIHEIACKSRSMKILIKLRRKLKFAILSLSGKARYWQIILHVFKTKRSHIAYFEEKKFEDEIARYIAIKSLEWKGGEIDISVVEIDNFLTCQQILRRVFTTNDSKINKKLNKTSLLVDSRLDNDVNIYYQHVYILLYPVSYIRSNRYIDWEWQSRNYINF